MNLKPSANPSAKLSVKGQNDISFSTAQYIEVHERTVDVYEGAYEFTPTDEPQTIAIENKRATQNITINPIPSNYGLITWDGATLTVS